MGCSRSAIDDDENDHWDFMKDANLLGLNTSWKVYSPEAGIANRLFKSKGLTGAKLVAAVNDELTATETNRRARVVRAMSKLTLEEVELLGLEHNL